MMTIRNITLPLEIDEHELFVPETILPSQMLESSREYTGPQKLMLAMLQDAVNSIRLGCQSNQRDGEARYWDAVTWVASRDNTWLYDFERVCEVLDVDSDLLRQHLDTKQQTKTRALQAGRIRRPMTPLALAS